MALSDIVIYDDGVFGVPGAKTYKVNTGGPAGISAGELVIKKQSPQTTAGAAGKGSYVTKWTAGSAALPSAGTDFIAGLAASSSTETLSASGTVDVFPNLPGMTYLGNPNVAATWNTQAKYDLLVGARVLLNCSSAGVQTILATDNTHALSANNGIGSGLIIEPLNVLNYPGKVRFSIAQSLNYNQ